MKQYRFLIGLGLLLAVTLAGCAQGQSAPETVPSTQSVAPTESAVKAENETQRECDWILCTSSEERQSFSSEDLGGNFDGSLYLNRLEVSVVVDGTKMSLEDAVREEKFTIEQLIANVQTDARKGVCTEETRTINGLTEFHYTYKDVLVLDVINDVYQTPDGQEHLFRKVTISKNGPNYDKDHDFTDVTVELPNIRIDREDWGLTFEVEDITATGLTLKTTQSGGQQAGSLEVCSYWVASNDADCTYSSTGDLDPAVPVTMDGTGSIRLTWDGQEFPAGEYFVKVWVRDNYDPETIHPLIHKYHDEQTYILLFTIP